MHVDHIQQRFEVSQNRNLLAKQTPHLLCFELKMACDWLFECFQLLVESAQHVTIDLRTAVDRHLLAKILKEGRHAADDPEQASYLLEFCRIIAKVTEDALTQE
jgi:hypothetical protein